MSPYMKYITVKLTCDLRSEYTDDLVRKFALLEDSTIHGLDSEISKRPVDRPEYVVWYTETAQKQIPY